MLNPGAIVLLLAAMRSVCSVEYSDLEAMGVTCPGQDRCRGYRNNMTYLERKCECDFACNTYKDCCVDSVGRKSNRRSPLASRVICMNYGESDYQGVYVIGNCPSSWRGPPQVRRKCEGPLDPSDPLNAAPVTSVAQAVTYRNRYCAECNYAHLPTLKTFQVGLVCDSLSHLTDEQIFADITYNRTLRLWGINRLDPSGQGFIFNECNVTYEVPGYLDSSIRFCRHGLVSTCPPDWTRTQVRKDCEDYMAVVFDKSNATGRRYIYRNVHCAICNGIPISDLVCSRGIDSRKRPMSFALLLDVNQSDGDQVGMRRVPTPACPDDHKYDPFFKKCRKLVCALPGYVIVNGRCAPPS